MGALVGHIDAVLGTDENAPGLIENIRGRRLTQNPIDLAIIGKPQQHVAVGGPNPPVRSAAYSAGLDRSAVGELGQHIRS